MNPTKIIPALTALQADTMVEIRDVAYATIETLLSKQANLLIQSVTQSLAAIVEFQHRLGLQPASPFNKSGD
jgi:hypothetical protein